MPLADKLAVRRLRPADASPLAELRREALDSAPLAFGSSTGDDRFISAEVLEKVLGQEDGNAVFGLFLEGALVGMTGLYLNMKAKELHKAHIWGMYVKPDVRRRGGAARLLDAAIKYAQQRPEVIQIHLSVTDAAPSAQDLYRKAGFLEWGCEPRALRWRGEFTDEHHLVLQLDRAPATRPPDR